MNKLTTRLLLAAIALVIGVFLLQLLGPNPRIAVSPQTTYLTTPLAADGLPDFATWFFDQQRAGLSPEDNAAIPFLQAMWPAGIDPEHRALVCREIGMPVPPKGGVAEPGGWGDPLELKIALRLLADRNLKPNQPIDSYEEFDAWVADWLNVNGAIAPWFDEQWRFVEEPDSQDPFEAARFWAQTIIDQSRDEPWTRKQLPDLADFVESHAANYDLLHEAARRPGYFFPSPTLLEDPEVSFMHVVLPDMQTLRSAVRALSRRAMLHLGEGRPAEAWGDIEAMHRLAGHCPDEFLVGQLVLIAWHGVADEATLQLLNAKDLPPELARTVHDYYQSRKPRREMHKSIDAGERIFAISGILEMSGSRSPKTKTSDQDFGADQMAVLRGVSVNWNNVLIEMNDWNDRIAAAMKTPDYATRDKRLRQIEADLDAIDLTPGRLLGGVLLRGARDRIVADIFASLYLPAVSAAESAQDRYNAKLQLMQVATALAVYRAENGAYPESLDALKPDLLAKPPVDAYLGKPLAYAKTETGYLLTNAGANGADDGGSNEQLSVYKGYTVSDAEDETAIRELLGEPVEEGAGDKDAADTDPDDFDAIEYGAAEWAQTLAGSIPAGADDWAIRMPPLPADWSMLTPPQNNVDGDTTKKPSLAP